MDNDPFSNGFAFDLSNIWRSSVFQIKQDDESLFQPLTAALPELQFDDADNPYREDFQIPDLIEDYEVPHPASEGVDDEIPNSPAGPKSISHQEDATPDIWTLDLRINQNDAIPRLNNWEAFGNRNVPNSESTAYLAEAGPRAFNAALAQHHTLENGSGILPQDVMLRALCNLVLGRSSVFFQWDASKKQFFQTLDDVPASGLSLQCYGSYVTRLMEFGSHYRVLSGFALARIPSKRSCTAAIALKGCVTSILESVEGHITHQLPQIRSLLRLQSLVGRSHQLLQVLQTFVISVDSFGTDEELITTLSNHVIETMSSGSPFGKIFQEVLAKVSAPWLERLSRNLGLAGTRVAQSSEQDKDDGEDENEDSSFTSGGPVSKTERFPEFVRSDDRDLIRETRASLKLLRQHFSEHELASLRSNPLETRPLFGDQFGSSAPDALSPHGDHFHSLLHRRENDCSGIDTALTANSLEHSVWAGDGIQREYLTDLDARICKPLGIPSEDRLAHLTASNLGNERNPAEIPGSSLLRHLDFNPLEHLRSRLQDHGRQVNRTLLRYLFLKCRLRHHLDLQRQFHLFGNGDFVARLTKALFSDDAQSARRKRGQVPTGEAMGLRLGARSPQNWPPASSEIQLTLMGILADTYHAGSTKSLRRQDIKALPGGLSFSVRELPESEIERVVDSGSIYALDFLKLQYAPPPPLDAILTSTSMRAYDSVFLFLLRFLRVLHVTTTLRQRFATEYSDSESGSRSSTIGAKFAVEAHHCISTIISHFMDVGIAVPWRVLTKRLTDVERALSGEESLQKTESGHLIGLEGLRQLHETCLENVRSRLFLRRKQDKIRGSIEEILAAVLKCAAALESKAVASVDAALAGFRHSTLGLLDLLHASVDKPPKATNEIVEQEMEAMKLLLLRLNWNGFYDNAT